MYSIHVLTTNDQVTVRRQLPSSKARKRIKHALPVVPHYATHTNAPTLAEVQDAAAGAFARLLVAYFAEQGKGGAA